MMCGVPSASHLAHEAFLYGSVDEFVGAMAPLVRAGLARGDKVFAAAKGSSAAALREELGDDAGRMELHDTAEWMTSPYDRLQAFRRMADGLAPGQTLTAMGEPVWDGSAAVVRQWARYESVVNLALAYAPMEFVCLYDASALPDGILDYAVRTHPHRIDDGRAAPCAGFEPPAEFVLAASGAAPADARPIPLDGAELRAFVYSEAVRAGMAPERAEELVLATSEALTNACIHGDPPLRALLWTEDGEMVCRIADSGPGIADPLAGWLPPARPNRGGWGLPIARQLCDALELARNENGTTVSLHVALAGQPVVRPAAPAA
jgi:anti-sigma regulatory factor (Ser/Thr protein kinase)